MSPKAGSLLLNDSRQDGAGLPRARIRRAKGRILIMSKPSLNNTVASPGDRLKLARTAAASEGRGCAARNPGQGPRPRDNKSLIGEDARRTRDLRAREGREDSPEAVTRP